jgi:surface protein
MYGMFEFSVFNKDISQWDVSNVTDMETMFKHSKFNKDISQWDIKKANRHEMFTNCPIKDEYLPKSYKINEGFDFGSVNKERKYINVFPKIRELIKKPYKKLT